MFLTTFTKKTTILNILKNVLTQEAILDTVHHLLWHVDITVNIIWMSTNCKGDVSL